MKESLEDEVEQCEFKDNKMHDIQYEECKHCNGYDIGCEHYFVLPHRILTRS